MQTSAAEEALIVLGCVAAELIAKVVVEPIVEELAEL